MGRECLQKGWGIASYPQFYVIWLVTWFGWLLDLVAHNASSKSYPWESDVVEARVPYLTRCVQVRSHCCSCSVPQRDSASAASYADLPRDFVAMPLPDLGGLLPDLRSTWHMSGGLHEKPSSGIQRGLQTGAYQQHLIFSCRLFLQNVHTLRRNSSCSVRDGSVLVPSNEPDTYCSAVSFTTSSLFNFSRCLETSRVIYTPESTCSCTNTWRADPQS